VLGTQDLLIGLVLAAFFFGAKRLPELARSLGQSMTEFKKAVGGDDGGRNVPESAAPPSVPPESTR
jgi:sec-independent protein translocase protein TatA